MAEETKFVIENIWQEHKKTTCTIRKTACHQIIIYPDGDGKPCAEMNIYAADGTTLIKDHMDKMRYPMTYFKFVNKDTGVMYRSYYKVFLGDAVFDAFFAIPEMAALQCDTGITEEDFEDMTSDKAGDSGGSHGDFYIITCATEADAAKNI